MQQNTTSDHLSLTFAALADPTRRAILAYRRTLENTADNAPLFQARGGVRFTGAGLRLVFRRLSKRTGIKVSPHAMRRTFVILSLRGDMDVLHLQAMLGHSSLAATQIYTHNSIEKLKKVYEQAHPKSRIDDGG